MVPGAVNILLEQIARNGLVPEQVVVEVTEDEFISRFDDFEKAIHQLRHAGISLAIDDFGAGFAGLSLLARLQPEKLKIDRSLIEAIHTNGPKQAIVQAIVNCCASLEISTKLAKISHSQPTSIPRNETQLAHINGAANRKQNG